jgi:glycosyltransferase involved in cell wall biosynthesis
LFSAARVGRRLTEQLDIQVIHAVSAYEAFSAALARGAGPAAIVLSIHGDLVTEQNQRWKSRWRRRFYLPFERAAFRKSDAVTTSSRWLQGRLAAQIDQTRADVIPNGIAVSLGEASAVSRQALGLPENRTVVLTVNNLYAPYRRQGLALLAAAAPSVVERIPDVLFVVAGGVNDPARDSASLAWAHSLTQGLPFLFTGYRPRSPADLMAAADVYVHSSTLDNSPTAVLEAMALGKPIVSTAVGGIPEIVSHEQTGLLVPLDPSALASATVRLLEDRPFARALGEKARERTLSEFTWTRTGQAFTELYQQVVQTRSRASQLDSAQGSSPGPDTEVGQ